jgi:uncharacterized protein (UPF0332 family)
MKSQDIKTLVQHRLNQAIESLGEADVLARTGKSPRSVINRCYYAMFYAALALLQTIGKISPKHTGVLSLFDTEFVRKGLFPREMSKEFHRTFKLRQTSDYEVASPLDAETVEEIRKESSSFVAAVNQFLVNQEWI